MLNKQRIDQLETEVEDIKSKLENTNKVLGTFIAWSMGHLGESSTKKLLADLSGIDKTEGIVVTDQLPSD